MARKLFVNLAVRDLKASMAFFSKLGFEYDHHWELVWMDPKVAEG